MLETLTAGSGGASAHEPSPGILLVVRGRVGSSWGSPKGVGRRLSLTVPGLGVTAVPSVHMGPFRVLNQNSAEKFFWFRSSFTLCFPARSGAAGSSPHAHVSGFLRAVPRCLRAPVAECERKTGAIFSLSPDRLRAFLEMPLTCPDSGRLSATSRV